VGVVVRNVLAWYDRAVFIMEIEMKYLWLLIYGLGIIGLGQATYAAWAWTGDIADVMMRVIWTLSTAYLMMGVLTNFTRTLRRCLV